MSAKDRPAVGQIFYVPLFEGGYAFGYVTLVDQQSGTLCSFFDLTSEIPELPEGLTESALVIEDMLVTGAEFQRSKRIGDKRWIATEHRMPGEVRAKHTKFIMRSRPVFQIVDLAVENSKRPATADEIERYPLLSTDFPLFTTKIVEKAVRHLDIDAKLIGKDPSEARLH